MFQQLLESNAVFQPRIGGSMVSTVGHAAAIAALVAFTATTPETRAPEVLERPIYIAPPPVLPVTRANPTSTAPTPSAPQGRTCHDPCVEIAKLALVEIPVGVTAVDLARPLSGENGNFGARNTGPVGIGIGYSGLSNMNDAFSAAQVDRPVLLRPGSPTPAFPDALRAAGVSGAVMAEFVVDTLGRVEPESVQLLTVDYDQFGAAVRSVLPRLRFIPAEVQGRKVRQLVRLPFRFDLHDLEENSNLGLI